MRLKLLIIGMVMISISCTEPTVGQSYGTMSFNFSFSDSSEARLEIQNRFDKVIIKHDYGKLGPGSYEYVWDGRDAEGVLVQEGLYYGFLRIKIEGDWITYTTGTWVLDPNR